MLSSMEMQLHIEHSGPCQAPVILFLHGGGLNGRQWQPQMDRLTEYHCLAPDLPEHGLSRAIGPFTLHDATHRIIDSLRSLDVPLPVHVVGSSLGAAVALNLLLEWPQSLQSVLITGGSAGLSRALTRLSLVAGGVYRWAPAEAWVQLAYRQFGVPEAYRQVFHTDLLRSMDAGFNTRITQALHAVRLPEDVDVPVLALVGERETFPAKQAAQTLARRLRNAQALEVRGAGHLWNLEQPALFTRTLRAWVEQAPLPPELSRLGSSTYFNLLKCSQRLLSGTGTNPSSL